MNRFANNVLWLEDVLQLSTPPWINSFFPPTFTVVIGGGWVTFHFFVCETSSDFKSSVYAKYMIKAG